jgi:hypothetical protein
LRSDYGLSDFRFCHVVNPAGSAPSKSSLNLLEKL